MANNFNSVREYKEYFDNNFFKGNKFQTALFINFLMGKKVKNNEIYTLTGVKRSQITNYKKIIKLNKIDELKRKTFREIFKDINGHQSSGSEDDNYVDETKHETKTQKDLISAIEDIDIDDDFVDEFEALDEVAQKVNGEINRFPEEDYRIVLERKVNINDKSFTSFLSINLLRRYYAEIEYYEDRIKDLEEISGIKNIEDVYFENEELKERIRELEDENKKLRGKQS